MGLSISKENNSIVVADIYKHITNIGILTLFVEAFELRIHIHILFDIYIYISCHFNQNLVSVIHFFAQCMQLSMQTIQRQCASRVTTRRFIDALHKWKRPKPMPVAYMRHSLITACWAFFTKNNIFYLHRTEITDKQFHSHTIISDKMSHEWPNFKRK